MCMFVAIMGEKRKKCIVFSLFLFFTLFFSLSPSLFLAFFVVRAQSRGYSPRKSEEEKNKKRKQDISIQQKHNNDDSAAVYCLPSNSTYLATVRGKKRERERERIQFDTSFVTIVALETTSIHLKIIEQC